MAVWFTAVFNFLVKNWIVIAFYAIVIALLIIYRKKMINPEKRLDQIIAENDELISILFRCVDTAKKNLKKKYNVSYT